MREKKFSPEDVLKILRVCNANKPISERCPGCPAHFGGCSDFDNETLAADTIDELLERRQMDADLMQEQKERIVELEDQLRWVPVGERLPDLDDGAVLLDGELTAVKVLAAIEGAKRSTELYFDGEEFFDYTGDEIIPYRVTHWRPMPEVPGEEG